MMVCFSRVAGQSFTKLELNVVKLSLQVQFVLEFRSIAPLLQKGCRQMGHFQKRLKLVAFPLKFNRGHKTEKA